MSEPEHIDLTDEKELDKEFTCDTEDDEETPPISLEDKEPPKLKRRLSASYETYASRLALEEKASSCDKHFEFLEATQRTSQRTPAAVYKFDEEIFGFFELTANVDFVRLMRARFYSKRLRELAALHALSWRSLSDLVDQEWEAVDNDLRAGHIIFAFWKMMCYCGRAEGFK